MKKLSVHHIHHVLKCLSCHKPIECEGTVFMITYVLYTSCLCKISALCVLWIYIYILNKFIYVYILNLYTYIHKYSYI